MLIIWYVLDNDLLGFLYTEADSSELDVAQLSDTITFLKISPDMTGCPNMEPDDEDGEKELREAWKALSKGEKERCETAHRATLDKERRKELDAKEYA